MIKDILILQKRELAAKLKELYIEREIKLLSLKTENDLIKVIIGPRRAGKSLLAIHLLNNIGNFGYVNFDDEQLVLLTNYDEIMDNIKTIYNKPQYLLLDEVQNLKNWELFVNRLQRQGYRLILTGSSSKLLSSELATHLTGRHLAIELLPFSFKEFLKFKNRNQEPTTSEIKTTLLDYLEIGGFPEPLVKKLDYRDYLSTLLNSIIYKDIVKRFRIRAVQGIDDLASYLLSNIAKSYSYNTLAQVSKCKSVQTIDKYLQYLEEAFILFKLNRFSFKFKEQTSAPKKIYCFDNGFINVKAFRISGEKGRLYENVVAIQLKKIELAGKARIFYWQNRQQEEVDFIIKEGANIKQLIQVCYNLVDQKTKKREIRALIQASRELKCSNLLIITQDNESDIQEEWFGVKRKIRTIPLWKWLLSN